MNRREKFLGELQTTSMSRKVRVIKAMEARGWLDMSLTGLSKNIDAMHKVLEEVMPGQYDFIVSKNWNDKHTRRGWDRNRPFYAEVVLHYPEIVITNRDDQRHLIRDMYLKLMPCYTGERGMSFNEFRGKRMTATKKEIVSNYQHSHLSGRPYCWAENSDNVFQWRNFCLGSSEIKQALAMLGAAFTEERLKLLLFQLDEYLNYESIEGNPYCYIKNVLGGGEMQKMTPKQCRDYYNVLVKKRERGAYKPEIDFKLEGTKVRVVDNDKLEEFIKYDQPRRMYSLGQIAERNELGDYFGYRNIPESFTSRLLVQGSDLMRVAFMFRGQEVNFQVVTEPEDAQDKPFYINKHIKEYVKARIETGIETKRFAAYIVEQLNTPTYTTRNTGQNRLSVSEN